MIRYDCTDLNDTWSANTKHEMQKPFYNAENTRNRIRKWLSSEGVTEHLTDLLKNTIDRFVDSIDGDERTLDKITFLPSLINKPMSDSYERVSIANESEIHTIHQGFRNEWWNLVGTYDGRPIYWQCWRHTLFPRSQWASDDTYTQHSVVRFAWCFKQDSEQSPKKEFVSTPMYESWHVSFVEHQPRFRAQLDSRHVLESLSNHAMFPMQLHWQGFPVPLVLDNAKPAMMLHSNTCLSCTDGIGMKMYFYPAVESQDKRLQAHFAHGWESGVLPEGNPSNYMLKSYSDIERYTKQKITGSPVLRSDQWFLLVFHLSNDVQVISFSTYLFKTPHKTVLIGADKISRVIHDAVLYLTNSIFQGTLQFGDYVLHYVCDEPVYDYRRLTTLTLTNTENVTGTFKNERIFGRVYIESPDRRSYDVRAREILSQVFGEPDMANRFDAAYFASGYANAPLPAIAVWLIPTLIAIGIVLIIARMLYIRHKQKQLPWKIEHPKVILVNKS